MKIENQQQHDWVSGWFAINRIIAEDFGIITIPEKACDFVRQLKEDMRVFEENKRKDLNEQNNT